jgi:hypothetical protein
MDEFMLHPSQVQVGKYGTVLDVVVADGWVALDWPKSSRIVPRRVEREPISQPADVDAAIATMARRCKTDVERIISTQMKAAGYLTK